MATTVSPEEARRVLGVAPGASPQEIAAAFRAVVQTAHPDRATGSVEQFRRAALARDVLLGPPTGTPDSPWSPPQGNGARSGTEPGAGEPHTGRAQDDPVGDLGGHRSREGDHPYSDADADADTGPVLRPVTEPATPEGWRVDVWVALGGAGLYVLLIGLARATSVGAFAYTAVCAAVLVLGFAGWSAAGRLRRLPRGWPRLSDPPPRQGEHTDKDGC